MEASMEPLHNDVQTVIKNFPVEIPVQLINLLRAFGYVNVMSVSSILNNFDEKIYKIETFAREDLPFLIEDNEKINFYGIYAKIPQKFRLLEGFKHLLMKLAEQCKKSLDELSKTSSKPRRDLKSSLKYKGIRSGIREGIINKLGTKQTNQVPEDRPDEPATLCNSEVSGEAHQASRSSSRSSPASPSDSHSESQLENAQKPEKGEEYIKGLLKKYIKKVCRNVLEDIDRDIEGMENLQPNSEPNRKDLEKTSKETKKKKDLLEELLTQCDGKIDALDLHIQNGVGKVVCLICGHISKIYTVNTKYGNKWVTSNFNKHFNSHFNKKNEPKGVKKISNSSSSILSFLIVNNENPRKNLSGNHSGSQGGNPSGNPCENSITFKSQQGQLSQAGNTEGNTEIDSENNTIISLSLSDSLSEPPLVLTRNENIEENIPENISNNESNEENNNGNIGNGSITADNLILLEQQPIDEAQDETLAADTVHNAILNENFFGDRRTTCEAANNEASSSAITLPPKQLFSKWKDDKYSRQQRYQRSLEVFDETQSKITDFFDIVKLVEENILQDEKTKEEFVTIFRGIFAQGGKKDTTSEITSPRTTPLTSPRASNNCERNYVNNVMKLLSETATKNSKKNKNANRFESQLKLFCLYIYISGGPSLYETLYKNLKQHIPSVSTLSRKLSSESTKNNMREGEVRITALKEFLLKRNLPLNIFLSEDQTAVTKRIEYDSHLNKMVGFVSPLNTSNGFPEKDCYVVNNLKDIVNAFSEKAFACNLYTFMAQPLVDNAPAFVLAVFGTDNKFTSEDVIKRWNFIKNEAERNEITVEGIASDGDPRCLRAMRMFAKFPVDGKQPGSESFYDPYFIMDLNNNKPTVFQDAIHIATKMKTRFLKPEVLLPMGNLFVSQNHIIELMTEISKDKHLLYKSYLDGTDKMNFEAIDKLSSEKVLKLLENRPDSCATRQYLKIVRYILDTFLKKDLDNSKRIYNIWYSVLFLRRWRFWIKNNKYSLQYNCLTLNAYISIELNAHNLILMMEKCKKSGTPLLPWLYSSQPCEAIFRYTRSMTTSRSTMVNYSVRDILRRLDRIQILNEIGTDLKGTFIFSRESKRLGEGLTSGVINENSSEIPSREQILNILKQADHDSRTDCISLGMDTSKMEISFSGLFPISEVTLEVTVGETKDDDDEERAIETLNENKTGKEITIAERTILDDFSHVDLTQEINDQNDINFLDLEELNLKHCDWNNVKNTTPYLNITLNNNKTRCVKKSSLCWLFSEKKGKLSSDRLLRVRGMTAPKRTAKIMAGGSQKNSKVVKKRKCIRKGKIAKKVKVCDSSNDKSEESSSEGSNDYESESELECETFSDMEVNEESSEECKDKKNIKLEKENYYAIFYDTKWYIGRITELNERKCTVKFLKEDLDDFVWPKEEDIQEIDNKFIFYGPINLLGIYPFKINRSDRLALNKLYKGLKKN